MTRGGPCDECVFRRLVKGENRASGNGACAVAACVVFVFLTFLPAKKLKKSKTLDKPPSFKSTNLIRKYTTSVGGWVIIGEKAIKKKITKRSRCRSTRQKGFFGCLSGSRCLSGSVERLGKKAPAARFSLGFFF